MIEWKYRYEVVLEKIWEIGREYCYWLVNRFFGKIKEIKIFIIVIEEFVILIKNLKWFKILENIS